MGEEEASGWSVAPVKRNRAATAVSAIRYIWVGWVVRGVGDEESVSDLHFKVGG